MHKTLWSFVGSHPEDIADGRMVAAGDPPVALDAEHPHNVAMIERGILVPHSEAAQKAAAEVTDPDGDDAAKTAKTKGGSK